MANMYSDMGNFLNEALNLESPAKKNFHSMRKNKKLNESFFNLDEYGELTGNDTIAYDKGWEHYNGDTDGMPEDAVWLVKSWPDFGLEGEIQGDSDGIYAFLYRDNGSELRSKPDCDSIGQAVLTVERWAEDQKYRMQNGF